MQHFLKLVAFIQIVGVLIQTTSFRLFSFTFVHAGHLFIVTGLQAILASRFRKSQKAEKGGLGDSWLLALGVLVLPC